MDKSVKKGLGKTAIPWADYGWNLVTGCTRLSAGCDRCYAQSMLRRFPALSCTKPGQAPTTMMRHHLSRACQPHHTRKPGLVFVAPLGDMAHALVPNAAWVDLLYESTAARHLTYAVLTKRPVNLDYRLSTFPRLCHQENIWWGTTVEDESTKWRIKELLRLTTGTRFVSFEPLIERVKIGAMRNAKKLSWVIVGCESGPGRRPCKLEWVDEIVDWALENKIYVWVKQIEICGKVTSDMGDFPAGLCHQDRPLIFGEEVKRG